MTAKVSEMARRPRNCRQSSAMLGAKSRKTPAGMKRGLAERRLSSQRGQTCWDNRGERERYQTVGATMYACTHGARSPYVYVYVYGGDAGKSSALL